MRKETDSRLGGPETDPRQPRLVTKLGLETSQSRASSSEHPPTSIFLIEAERIRALGSDYAEAIVPSRGLNALLAGYSDAPYRRPRKGGIEARFFTKVDKHGPYPFNPKLGRCWLWTGAKTTGTSQYGSFWIGGRALCAHIVSYALAGGTIPDGWDLDHVCRNKRCVNPNHLNAVTRQENMRRAVEARRWAVMGVVR